MFGSECLGELQYEATTASIFMAGLFLSFLLEYIGYRFVKLQARKAALAHSASGTVIAPHSLRSLESVSVYVMEAGIIFHSMSKCPLFLFPSSPRKEEAKDTR